MRCFFDGFFNLPGSLGIRQAAARSLDAVNSWIVGQSHADPQLLGMATTFTALILDGRAGHCVHVGDSRLYRFREGTLERLTEDHVMGRGEFSHVLRRAVGLEDAVALDHSTFALRSHERYLLCSDGVHGPLGDARLRAILALRHAPEPTAQELVAAALDAGGADNATAVIVDILDTPPADEEEISDHFGELPILAVPKIGDLVDDYRIDKRDRRRALQPADAGAGFAQRRAGGDEISAAARGRGKSLSPRLHQRGLRRRSRAQPVDRRGDRATAGAPDPGSIRSCPIMMARRSSSGFRESRA